MLDRHGNAHAARQRPRSRGARADPVTPLLYVLRNELGFTGAKFGCGVEQCGACAVLVDGRSVFAATRRRDSSRAATSARSRRADEPTLDARESGVRRRRRGAMRLLHPRHGDCRRGVPEQSARPTEGEIRAALTPHLCRCGTPRAHSRGGAPARSAGCSPVTTQSLERYPDVDDWIVVGDGRVTVRTGKVDIGQRISTALALIAAEELDVALRAHRSRRMSTRLRRSTRSYTSASNSIERCGNSRAARRRDRPPRAPRARRTVSSAWTSRHSTCATARSVRARPRRRRPTGRCMRGKRFGVPVDLPIAPKPAASTGSSAIR